MAVNTINMIMLARSSALHWMKINLNHQTISTSVNAVIAVTAGSVAATLASRPGWLKAQRWLMGTVLAGLALHLASEARR